MIKEYLRLSSFELAFVLCESGALSTEPPPASIFIDFMLCSVFISSIIAHIALTTNASIIINLERF